MEKLVLCEITPRPDQGGRQRRAIAKTALGAEDVVAWEYEAETSIAIARAVAAGVVLYELLRRSREGSVGPSSSAT